MVALPMTFSNVTLIKQMRNIGVNTSQTSLVKDRLITRDFYLNKLAAA